MCWGRCLTVWFVGVMTGDSLESSARRGLILFWHKSRSVAGSGSTGRALTSKTHFFLSLGCGEVIGLKDKHVHERKREVVG